MELSLFHFTVKHNVGVFLIKFGYLRCIPHLPTCFCFNLLTCSCFAHFLFKTPFCLDFLNAKLVLFEICLLSLTE